MTTQTQEQIKKYFVSGMEDAHGKPWWDNPATYNPEHHFPGPIPIEFALKFFSEQIRRAHVWVEDEDGNPMPADDFMAAMTGNTIHEIHKQSFEIHQFDKWLIEGPAQLVNSHTGISNLGKLNEGAQAWVNISTPEQWKTVQGIDFRPQLLCTTACDGTLASTYAENDVISLCDNTVRMALSRAHLTYKVRHTKNSQFKVHDAMEALNLLEQNAEAFKADIAALSEYEVSNQQFERFIAQLVPMPEIKDKDINKRDYSTRNATIAAQKREKLNQLYRADGRVAPWQGTALGVLQLINTYNTHESSFRNQKTVHRAERNMRDVMDGSLFDKDADALALLAKVCERELVAA
jgi:phage/plasmid-like protein (TIGR03299 family)